jgi:Lon protease-like protein
VKAGNCAYRSPGDLPESIPVFPLRRALLLPRSDMPLNIFEPRYVAMIDWAWRARIVGMVNRRGAAPGSPTLLRSERAITSAADRRRRP